MGQSQFLSARTQPMMHEHTVQFYETDAFLCERVCRFLSVGLREGNPVIVIATPEHRKAFFDLLRAQGWRLDRAIESQQLIELDALQTLGSFMDGETPHSKRFNETVGGLIERASARSGGLPIVAYGEMVDLLWRRGNCEGAIQLEQLWNDLAGTHRFDLLCAYSMTGFDHANYGPQFENICAKHSAVIPTERYTGLKEDDRLREITLLQQRALSLANEVQHRNQIESELRHVLEVSRRNEHSLRLAEAELRNFLENAVECLHWIGPDGEVLWANQMELDLLGYSRDEYIGHNITEFHADREVIQDILKRLSDGETLRNYEARLRCKDGSIRYVLINSNVLRQDGKFIRTQCFTRDISELKKAEKTELFLSSIVESADDAIVGKTLDGIVTNWNPGAERLFGYTAEEMIGKPIAILVPPDHPDEEPRILERLRRGERIDHYETRRIRKDGEIRDISLTVSPVKDHLGRIIGASKIARDITDSKRLQSERDQLLVLERTARFEAEAASRVKDEFLAVLSHELRTPLNAILGWTKILETHQNEDDLVHRAVEVIQRNAAVQKRVIEDLLDMARILTGKMVIKSDTVDLDEVLGAAIDSVAPAAAAKAIRINQVTGTAVCFVRGDADRLQQVFWNLLANAIKFTPTNGEVELSVQSSTHSVEVIVRDTGQGIPAEFLPYVFERFRQADGTASRHHGGLGLGLAVVRYLVEAHGGTVSATSAGPGKGSTFVVSFPLPS